MPEVDGLRPLQVGVGGRGPVAVRLRLCHQDLHQRLEQRDRAGGVSPHEQGQVRRHLIVPRARRVQLAAERPDQLGQAALDRHMDVLVVLMELEAPLVELATDAIEAFGDLPKLGLIEHAELRQGARMRLRLLDVERRQAPVE